MGIEMYVLVAKIFFSLGGMEHDEVLYRRLGAKLRARHRVCAQVYGEGEQAVLAVTALAPQPETLRWLCEKLSALCEREGLGRVVAGDEPSVCHIDSLLG